MNVCCSPKASATDHAYRRVLLIALALNAAMFTLEIVAGVISGSSSLLADAVDFGGDASNYALSIWALALATTWRSRVALLKGLSMGGYGVFVLAVTALHASRGTVPEAATMGTVGFLALAVNIAVAVLLFGWRNGDADMRSVWLCSRNDAISSTAVLLAAAGVFGTASGWPDYAVAAAMAALALASSASVVRQARREILSPACASES